MEQYASFLVRGTGAAVNIPIGWYPDLVWVKNLTDGDLWTVASLMGGRRVMVFSSGDGQIQAGDSIRGATSGARGLVVDVILDSGSWAGGDAAGWLVLDSESITGTFAGEAIYITRSADGVIGDSADDATGAALADIMNNASAAAVAGATGNAAVSLYAGVAGSIAKGITLGLTISEDAKLLAVHCFRNLEPRNCPNSL